MSGYLCEDYCFRCKLVFSSLFQDHQKGKHKKNIINVIRRKRNALAQYLVHFYPQQRPIYYNSLLVKNTQFSATLKVGMYALYVAILSQ